MWYSKEQCLIIAKTRYITEESFLETVARQLRAIFSCNDAPKRLTVHRLIKKIVRKFTLTNEKTTVRHRLFRSIKNTTAVRESVAGNPGTSEFF